jgi:hypothetical protein
VPLIIVDDVGGGVVGGGRPVVLGGGGPVVVGGGGGGVVKLNTVVVGDVVLRVVLCSDMLFGSCSPKATIMLGREMAARTSSQEVELAIGW